MMVLLLLALQAAPPDIELRAEVRARSIIIQRTGKAEVRVNANDHNVVAIEEPKANGRKRINNPVYTVDIKAYVVDPLGAPASPPPQSQ